MSNIQVKSMYVGKRLYLCDPEKNTECKKTICQTDCFHTTKIKCRKNMNVYRADAVTGEIICTRKGRSNETVRKV